MLVILDSLKLELWIEGKAVSEVYYADATWKIKMSSLDGVVTLEWLDFLDIVNEFQKFVASESVTLIEEAKKPRDE